MASWILVPSLVALRNEFNKLAPDRDKASDGSIGDTSHQQTSSDHNPDETGRTPYSDADRVNEVHAIDVDDDLRLAGWSMNRALEIIITRHREGRDNRLQNVIYNRRIWSRSWGWTARAYTGANAHTEHAHFSARYTTAQESDTRAWGLLEDDDVTKSEFTAWMTEWARSGAGKQALAIALLTYDPGKDANGNIRPGGVSNVGDAAATNPTVAPAYALNRAVLSTVLDYQIRDKVDALQSSVDTLIAAFGDSARSPEETAAALRTALGDRAGEIGRLLAA
jgi:hypothetical protein